MTDAGAHGLQHQWTAGDAPLACATEPLWGAWPSDPLWTLPVHLGTPGPWSWEAGWELEGTSLGGWCVVLTSAGEGLPETQCSFHGGQLGGPEGAKGKAACWEEWPREGTPCADSHFAHWER